MGKTEPQDAGNFVGQQLVAQQRQRARRWLVALLLGLLLLGLLLLGLLLRRRKACARKAGESSSHADGCHYCCHTLPPRAILSLLDGAGVPAPRRRRPAVAGPRPVAPALPPSLRLARLHRGRPAPCSAVGAAERRRPPAHVARALLLAAAGAATAAQAAPGPGVPAGVAPQPEASNKWRQVCIT